MLRIVDKIIEEIKVVIAGARNTNDEKELDRKR
jgi:hypothetical protein